MKTQTYNAHIESRPGVMGTCLVSTGRLSLCAERGVIMEEWRMIIDFPDYAVSDCGRVKRATRGYKTYPGRIISAPPRKAGYCMVTLMRDKKQYFLSVHRLVAQAFLGEAGGLTVNHKDGCKTNNCASNIEYMTQGDNNRHASASGIRTGIGENHYRAKLKESDIHEIRLLRQAGVSIRKMALKFGVNHSAITSIFSGKTWKSVPALTP